jgi:hypothetical protein
MQIAPMLLAYTILAIMFSVTVYAAVNTVKFLMERKNL